MCVRMFHGDGGCCGVMTTGGTESIAMAVKAYRDQAHSRGIRHPNIVIPDTAHPAFDKVCPISLYKALSVSRAAASFSRSLN